MRTAAKEYSLDKSFLLCLQSYRLHSAPLSKNAVSAFQITCKLLFSWPWKIHDEISSYQCLSITKGRVYYIQHFCMKVDWPEILCLMEVSAMLYICTYYLFTLCRINELKVDDTPNGRSPRKDWFSPLCVMI